MKKIAAYFLIGIALIVITFFRKYTGNIILHPSLFYLLGFIFLLGAYLLIRSDTLVAKTKSRKQLEKTIADLKENGEKLLVDFSLCEIKENNYLMENDKTNNAPSRTNIIDAFAMLLKKADELQPDQTEVGQSVIIYRHQNQRTGVAEKFISPIIPKDKITLSFYLDQQKQTSLYVNQQDRNRYYFDLSFLSN